MSNPRIPFQLSDRIGPLPSLDGRQILVHLVINIEHWLFDAPMPRKLLGSPHGRDNVPDIPNYSWVEYGMRAGMPRVLKTLADRGMTASASMNASVITSYPALAEAVAAAGWEFIGHGITQQSLPGSTDERAVVEETLDSLERFTGARPRGWLGPGLAETTQTPDILSAAGVDYVCDWVVDDVPVWLSAEPRDLVAVPYALELNDSVLHAAQWYPAEEFERRLVATLKVFEAECLERPRVLAIALHPHLVGVPHRIESLRRMLDCLQKSSQVCIVTGSQICDWFLESATSQPNA
jgi:peptidoglycan/xylan/chitin deacetylase (PgdA/CDA1 family)